MSDQVWRPLTVASLLLMLTACGGGGSSSKPDTTAHFAETVRSAYSQAESQHSAAGWETFAITVQNTPAGRDTAQRGLLVSAAHHASDSYQARRDVISCTVNGATCPSPGADDTDQWMQRIAELVRGL